MTQISQRGYAGGTTRSDDRRETTFGVADLLHLAATPTFALMALLTAISGSGSMTCMGMAGSSPLGGMGLMYLLMAVFHVVPWARLASRGDFLGKWRRL